MPKCEREGCACMVMYRSQVFAALQVAVCGGCGEEMLEDSRLFDAALEDRERTGRKLENRKLALSGGAVTGAAGVADADQWVDKLHASEDAVRRAIRAWLKTPARHAHAAPNAGNPS